MYSGRYLERNVSPTRSGPPKKRAKPNYGVGPAPAVAPNPDVATGPAIAAAPTSTSATASKINDDSDLLNAPTSPHTPPDAPNKAQNASHRPIYSVGHQALFAKLYNEFHTDFEQKRIPKSHANVLRFAQERLAVWKQILFRQTMERATMNPDHAAREERVKALEADIQTLTRTIRSLAAKLEVKEGRLSWQEMQLKQQDKFIKAQDRVIPEQEYIIKEEKAHIVEQGKRIGHLEALLVEHGWDKGRLEQALQKMEQEDVGAKDIIETVVRGTE